MVFLLKNSTFQFNINQYPLITDAHKPLCKNNTHILIYTQKIWECKQHGHKAFQRCSWHFNFCLNFKISTSCCIYFYFIISLGMQITTFKQLKIPHFK